MTSEVDTLKTNEFLRRRKLRIQQVREQSKDIAKKIRQRANAEKFKQLVNLNSTKEKEYLEQQDKLIKKLEEIHAKNIGHIGASHKNAAEIIEQENKQPKEDLSKQRAREAAAELRRQKQEKLDERKKLLDKKLQARKIANEISREKSSSVANKLSKPSVTVPDGTCEETEQHKLDAETEQASRPEIVTQQTSTSELENGENDKANIVTTNMATQWDYESMPSEWEPTVPALALPKDATPRDSSSRKQSGISIRPNLFALSDEMPSDLRGGLDRVSEATSVKPSLSLVSDFIQNRDLRLRDYDKKINKKSVEDLQSIKQTILRSRAARVEVSAKSKTEKPTTTDSLEDLLGKKSSVTMYNHLTRDVKDVPCGGKKLVIRDQQGEDDAYAQALKESSQAQIAKEKDHNKKLADMRNKIAMSRQSVEKEYQNTMAFLKSLPKDKTRPIKNAYKDVQQEQMLKESRQRKLQHEFRKIQKECRRHMHGNSRQCSNTKKTDVIDSDDDGGDDFDRKDLQYSWMPVPESDELAVHIIPTKIKKQKSGNVKFSKIDCYHEYRSRHKHTPPTKDTCDPPADLTDSSRDSSHDDAPPPETRKSTPQNSDSDLSDADRIIIYKIFDNKSERKIKVKKSNSKKDVAKSLSFVNKDISDHGAAVVEKVVDHPIASSTRKTSVSTRIFETESSITSQQIKEGVYRTVSQKEDNLSSLSLPDEQNEKKPSKSETYNISSRLQPATENPLENHNHEPNSNRRPQTASTASFKTAYNLKAGSALKLVDTPDTIDTKPVELPGPPPGGYVKVIDETGQETGKFFIGTTGFLKDSDYEVVIQLRKSDTSKSHNKSFTKESDEKSQELITQTNQAPATEELKESNNTVNEMAVPVNIVEPEIKTAPLNDVALAPQPPKQHKLVDKEVDVPFIVPNVNAEAKQANSVSVQTSIDSPDTRHYRMSSSTSTTYMSPPEVILPTYMKCDGYDKEYVYYGPRGPKVYFLNELNHPKKKSQKPSPIHAPSKRIHSKSSQVSKTPPNTARSTVSENPRYHNIAPSGKKCGSSMSVPKPVRLHKCVKHNNAKPNIKSYIRKIRLAKTASIPGVPPPSTVDVASHRVMNLEEAKYFNPIMKMYVDKLLMMNKEGVKAIDVVNQECSSVTTPGSSIIDDLNNIDRGDPTVQPKISLEQLRQLIEQFIIKQRKDRNQDTRLNDANIGDTGPMKNCPSNIPLRFAKKRSVHKVKSLNISKTLITNAQDTRPKTVSVGHSLSGTSSQSSLRVSQKRRSKSSPSPRRPVKGGKNRHKTNPLEFIVLKDIKKLPCVNEVNNLNEDLSKKNENKSNFDQETAPLQQGYAGAASSYDSDTAQAPEGRPTTPLNTSTQTGRDIDEQIQFMQMAQDKLQNMEKIADLTEKCTKRLSNLAKVLDEVRKSKLAYSKGSESASDSDQTSGKSSDPQLPPPTYTPIVIEIKGRGPEPEAQQPQPVQSLKPQKELEKNSTNNVRNSPNSTNYVRNSPKSRRPKSPVFIGKPQHSRSPAPMSMELLNSKSRGKPPPALIRRSLKRTQEFVIPHELSTVVEIDSPINSKHKTQSARDHSNHADLNSFESDRHRKIIENVPVVKEVKNNSPDLLESSATSKREREPQAKADPSTDAQDESKLQMMDLKQFNEIMLKPFISIHEYAKQRNVEKLEEGSNLENTTLPKDDIINDEISSLHSDGSLPDVIAELLKRQIISEPFKFDTASNVNSTTASSDSTFSVLALSKAKKGKKKSNVYSNKENLAETSDTLSISSNPDLENAFKKLGLGWASSTLKKTKEHLALSSSSTNTSSSSLAQFKLKHLCKDFPALVADSMSSIKNGSNKSERKERNVSEKPVTVTDGMKTAAQQTSLPNNSLTVKQFLTNELAKRITFGNKSSKYDNTEEEFISMYETKMPEDMKNRSKRDERSADSNPRARTSTPVQIFKSMTYHSSSSSNVSNGLFSNVEDLSSVKGTSNSIRNHSTSERDDLTIPNFSLRPRKGFSDCSKSDD